MSPSDARCKDLGLAVIGAGRWGRNLIRVASSIGGASLEVVCDVDPQRLDELGGAFRITTRPEAVLEDGSVDAVILATPAEHHAALAVAALAAGKHVFVEKPLALTLPDAERIAEAQRQYGRVVMVGHILHYDPAYAALSQCIGRSGLGNLRGLYATRHAPSTRGDKGAWWALAPHDLSWGLARFRTMPVSATARRSRESDRTFARFEFGRDVVLAIDVCGRAPCALRHLVAVGDRGTAFVDATGPSSTLRVLPRKLAEQVEARMRDGMRGRNLFASSLAVMEASLTVEPVPVPQVEPLRNELAAFVDAVVRGSPVPTPVADGVAVTKLLGAVDRLVGPSRRRRAVRSVPVVRSPALP